MLELREWIASTPFDDRPWLILGKGPSFSRRHEFPLDRYHLLGLNNVVREQPVDVAHVIDVDVIPDIADRLLDGCRYLLMPRRPHVAFVPTKRLLEDFFNELPVLRELDERRRLVWYNAATSYRPPLDGSPVIGVRNFSSEAALNILGAMGVRTVRALGIDGGQTYGADFRDLQELLNGRPSFDSQFREMEEIVRRNDMDYDALTEPMRVYVGCDESQLVATRVLEASIRKHASRPVRVIPMLNLPTPVPKDPKNRGRTGFSFSRFHIPQLAGYKGRAVYLDADMQVFSDIAELFDWEMGEAKVMVTRQDEPPEQWKGVDWFHPGRQMSVMLLDCERLDWDPVKIVNGLDEGRYTYQQLMFDMCLLDEQEIGDTLPVGWNHLEHYVPGETRLLHYTVVPTQPWKNDENPLRHLWEQEFEEAKVAGIVRQEEVDRLARKGHIKRSLASMSTSNRILIPLYSLLDKVQAGLQWAEQRFPILKHPRVLALRGRVGRLLGGA